MEQQQQVRSGSKLETPDYDTFGSIDSLIFEPKLIDENEDRAGGPTGTKDQQPPPLLGPGKTTFAERVRLFQNLEKNRQQETPRSPGEANRPPQRKITFLEVQTNSQGQETSWKEVADNNKARVQFKTGEPSLMVVNQPEESYIDCTESCCGRGTSCSLRESNISCFTNHGESSDFCDCCTQCREEGDPNSLAMPPSLEPEHQQPAGNQEQQPASSAVVSGPTTTNFR